MGEKSERRSFVRRHHPDVGGDIDEFREGFKKYDVKPPPLEQPVVPAAPPAPPVDTVSPSASTSGPPVPPKPPAADRLARGLGRFAAKVAAKPAEVREAYREGRDSDTPL